MLILATIYDQKDRIIINNFNQKYFDLMQYYIITYTKEGFDKPYGFKEFLFFVMKVSKPHLNNILDESSNHFNILHSLIIQP